MLKIPDDGFDPERIFHHRYLEKVEPGTVYYRDRTRTFFWHDENDEMKFKAGAAFRLLIVKEKQ